MSSCLLPYSCSLVGDGESPSSNIKSTYAKYKQGHVVFCCYPDHSSLAEVQNCPCCLLLPCMCISSKLAL